MADKLYQYGEYRQPYQSELDYFKNNTNVGGMATEDNKIILNPYSSLNDREKHQVGLNEGVRLFLRENPNYIGNFGLTNQQKQSLGNYSNNIDDIRSTILARILTNDPSAGKATIRQKFNANRVRNAINRGLGQYGLGNIDLYARPQVKNPDGSISTVRSMSFNDGLKEVVIPTVSDDGRIMTDNQAIDNYYKTGKYLGKFDTVDEATKYAEQLHNEQDRYYNKNRANFINRLLGGF